MKAYAADGDSTTGTTGTTSTTSTQATTAQPGKDAQAKKAPGFFDSPLMLVILGAVWIWLIYSMRKNKKKQKKAKEKLNNISKGDKVVTIGRIHGEVVKLTEDTFTIKPDKKSDFTLTFDRNAIMSINAGKGESEETPEGVAEKIEQK